MCACQVAAARVILSQLCRCLGALATGIDTFFSVLAVLLQVAAARDYLASQSVDPARAHIVRGNYFSWQDSKGPFDVGELSGKQYKVVGCCWWSEAVP